MIDKIVKECEDEQIQFLNKIQDFGYLIAVNKESKLIQYVSENIVDLTSISSDLGFILNQAFNQIFDFTIDLDAVLGLEEGHIRKEYIHFKSKNFFCVVYHHEDLIYLEFEEDKRSTSLDSFYSNSEQILYAKDKAENWKFLIKKIKELTGYNRVLIYKFLEDKSGHVVYEEVDEGFDSYLGLHFPEFDIPHQARELYIKKRNRIVSNVQGVPVYIVGATSKPLDLTYSEFRSLSPVHLEYLENFNVQSSFSISIVVNNKLWGIVSCHNKEPKHIPINIRKQCEVLARMARISYVNFKFDEQLKFQEKFQKVMVKLKEELLIQDHDNYSIDNYSPLLKFTKADGVAYVKNDTVQTYLNTPSEQEIKNIRDWAKDQQINELFYSHTFYIDYHDQLNISNRCAGVAFRFLDSEYENFVIWFKEEIIVEVEWAGKPEKIIQNKIEDQIEIVSYSPRKNFEIWKSEATGKSNIWKEKEIVVIREIINLILETIHIKAFKIRELYDQLKEINDELDTFSYTISHDLRTPLTVMKLNCQLLQRSMKDDDFHYGKMKEIIQQIDNLSTMMQEILTLSRAKKSDLKLQIIDAESLIKRIVEESTIYYDAHRTEIKILNTIDFIADNTMAYEIFLNIINNAIKYSFKQELPQVEIKAEEEEDYIVYRIKDNGIGIKASDRHKMFKLFSRMSNTTDYRGNGVGLSIVYRLMQRLEGSIDFISEENKGTEFILKFRKEI